MSIKPVVIFKGVRHNSRTEIWGFLSTPDVAPQENAYLYAIPDTHRVVSVELLKQWAHDLDAEINARDIAEHMQAIIEDKPEAKPEN